MKITKLKPNGEIVLFPTLSQAADDAGIERRKFSRLLKKHTQVDVGDDTYSIPKEY